MFHLVCKPADVCTIVQTIKCFRNANNANSYLKQYTPKPFYFISCKIYTSNTKLSTVDADNNMQNIQSQINSQHGAIYKAGQVFNLGYSWYNFLYLF